ncbi:MAG: Crp/Fnr family transcriptional regulator, partial [Giesbergeria sp.]
MNASMPSNPKLDLNNLINAISQATADDSMSNSLSAVEWETLSAYISPMTLASGQTLFTQGASDRSLYFVESGSLSVHYQDEKERLRLAIVTAGSVVGEGAFFSHRPRSATVQATAPCKLWNLTTMRFNELSNRQPAIALHLVMSVGAVIAKRMGNRRRR